MTKEELVDSVWQGKAISDDALFVCVYELRKALGDSARSPHFIETVHGRGYRWIPAVEPFPTEPLSTENRVPRQRFAREGSGDAESGAAPEPGIAPRETSRRLIPLLVAGALLLLGLTVTVAGWPWAFRTTQDPFKTLAVLPLEDFSPDPLPPDRAFADGMTEALIQALARSGSLRIISRTSSRRFSDRTELSAPEIARQLGADLLLEGTVTRAGGRARVTLFLIDGAADRHLWTESYEEDLGDILRLQWRVAQAVATQIGRHTGRRPALASPIAQLRLSTTLRPEAVDAYLQGRYKLFQGAFAQGGGDALLSALAAFEQAVDLEPEFAEAHVGLAQSRIAMLWINLEDPTTNETAARQAATRAAALDPGLASAYSALGWILMVLDHDLDEAESNFQRALKLAPSQVETYYNYAQMLQARRRYDEAEAMARQARRVDPLSPIPLRLLATILYDRGRPQEALELVDQLDQLAPGAGSLLRAASLMTLGREEEAWEAHRQVLAALDVPQQFLTELDSAFELGGLMGMLSELKNHSQHNTLSDAVLLMRLGEPEAALRSLQEAAKRDDPQLLIVYSSPLFIPLHDDPRFRQILRQYDLLPKPL